MTKIAVSAMAWLDIPHVEHEDIIKDAESLAHQRQTAWALKGV